MGTSSFRFTTEDQGTALFKIMFLFMLHAPYSLTDIVGKALLWVSSVCWDTNDTTYVWDICPSPDGLGRLLKISMVT